ncbi:hypothetical protein P1J78_04150 [Psychromarinibacter sp. C21-152]|uniref:Uncharacterized protein n=1 Tax=Psychromarinibacter sediminicola TaxID=3033385 RepID=A0AAE3T738_9RHOB|nr:hypothetical protein [Psychromarinibacter sediminicola]MDF0599917.1 hypothetical protein [Psychromarinibacter sediminicola]
MEQRGRKSASSVEVVKLDSVERVKRPAAPDELTPEQKSIWAGIVDALPADWFSADNLPLLVQYVRHIVTARRAAQLIDAAEAEDPLDLDTLDRLYRMQDREGRAIASLATKMRITQQALTNHRGNKKRRPAQLRPWETE